MHDEMLNPKFSLLLFYYNHNHSRRDAAEAATTAAATQRFFVCSFAIVRKLAKSVRRAGDV